MKQFKIIISTILVLVLCLTLFTGCVPTEKHTCKSVCPECGKCLNADCTEKECSQKCEGHQPQIVLTQGVFSCVADATHETIVKFKEDGTFYAHGVMGQEAFFGKYELVDMEISYVDAGIDGNLDVDDDYQTILTSTKAVHFMHNDGSNYEVRNDNVKIGEDVVNLPNEEVNKSYVALTSDENGCRLHFIAFDNYTRTVKQDTTRTFTVEEEVKNVLYTFMPETLPTWATEGGYTLQELTFILYHNAWEDLATTEIMATGAYTSINGNVYTLDNGAVVTVSADGKTATFVKGTDTINLVEFKEAATAVATLTGNASLYNLPVTVTLFDDGTLELVINNNVIKGTYVVEATGIAVTGEGLTVTASSISEGNISISFSSVIMNTNFTVTVTGTGDLKVAPILVITSPDYSVFTLELYADHTVSVVASMGGTSQEMATGTWAFANYVLTVTLEDGETGSSSPADLQVGKLRVALAITAGGNETNVTFETAASNVAVLMG